jgi:hypothetical protein
LDSRVLVDLIVIGSVAVSEKGKKKTMSQCDRFLKVPLAALFSFGGTRV